MESLSQRAWRLRVRDAVTDPWTLLLCLVGGGVAWAIGVPWMLALVVSVAMLAVAGVAAVFREKPQIEGRDRFVIEKGTEQAQLVASLEGTVAGLRRLRYSELPDVLHNSAIESLVAAEGTRDVARRVAAAVDGLDDALVRAQDDLQLGDQAPGGPVAAVVGRMKDRRQALLSRLRDTVAGVQEVYAKLLELSATADLASLGDPHAPGGVADVSESLDSLRAALTELDADARRALPAI